ncbi:hypothetical protein RhiirC2_709853 [Rhizophagus irregularis]|uniref:HMG box domain-containing protein n=1 Tax=Rhizophagus irregularis TaxID=588596 RepID=A0A2N1NGS1_9GLOM|nr:hypothetical protein RhiirC2_709853 [Rhizophagus irregularis]
MSKPVRHMNAFICYRKDNIDHGSKLKMTDYSRFIAPKWQDESDLFKRKYYQAAAKDYVEKEMASGGNGTTIKSFEQFGNIAFVNETPICHGVNLRDDDSQNSDQYFLYNRNNDIKQETVPIINEEDLFKEFTIDSDFY